MNTKTISLNPNEIWPLINVLNEICHGLYIYNFEEIVGEKKEIIVHLMDKISEEEKKAEPLLILNNSELMILKNSFKEIFRQIDEWEFQTRVGITIQEAKKIEEKFK